MMNVDLLSMVKVMENDAKALNRELERRRIIGELIHDPRTGPVSTMRRFVSSLRSSKVDQQ